MENLTFSEDWMGVGVWGGSGGRGKSGGSGNWNWYAKLEKIIKK